MASWDLEKDQNSRHSERKGTQGIRVNRRRGGDTLDEKEARYRSTGARTVGRTRRWWRHENEGKGPRWERRHFGDPKGRVGTGLQSQWSKVV